MKTLGSLFDGSGGFPLAGRMNGITPVWASEIEPFPIRVTRKNFPTMEHLGSVTDIHGYDIEPVDVITFGSPCQNLSFAGNRQGLDGSQSKLFFEAVRIIKEMREATNGTKPRYVVWENVRGALSSNKGADFHKVLEEIIGIKEPEASIPKPDKWAYAGTIMGDNISLSWRVLDAQYFGVPQRRKRVFLVVDFDGQSTQNILFEPKSLSRHTRADGKEGQETARDTGNSADKASWLLIENNGTDARYKITDKSQTLTAYLGTGGNSTPLALNASKAPEPITLKMRAGCEGGGKGPLLTKNKTGTVTVFNDITLFEPVYASSKAYYFTEALENVANPLVATDHKCAQAVSYRTYEAENDTISYIVRRITPMECARLQGFPDDWC